MFAPEDEQRRERAQDDDQALSDLVTAPMAVTLALVPRVLLVAAGDRRLPLALRGVPRAKRGSGRRDG
jgi:hypothetical protein